MTATFDRACERFRATLLGIAALPDAEWAYLRPHLKPVRFRRGEDLVTAGTEPSALWFLERGILRFFYVSETGRELNKAFARSGEIVGALVAMVTGEPCGFTIQAMGECEAVALPARLLPTLYDRHPCWDRIGRVLAEQAAVRKEVREREFLIDDPLERYRQFLKRYPGIESQIPQRQIAAYIGISEVSLSRLLNR